MAVLQYELNAWNHFLQLIAVTIHRMIIIIICVVRTWSELYRVITSDSLIKYAGLEYPHNLMSYGHIHTGS